MSKLKFKSIFCIAICLTFLTGTTYAYKIEEVLGAFQGLAECDGSKKAEEICKKNCTADGTIMEGTCRDQAVWEQCLRVCRQDWIIDCTRTAAKHNLRGLPKCQ